MENGEWEPLDNFQFSILHFQLPKVHQHRTEQRNQSNEYRGHSDGILDMVREIEDVLPHVGVFWQHLGLHPFSVEQVGGTKLHPVLHQPLVGLEHFCPEIDIDKQHGNKQAYDEKRKYFEHLCLRFFCKSTTWFRLGDYAIFAKQLNCGRPILPLLSWPKANCDVIFDVMRDVAVGLRP